MNEFITGLCSSLGSPALWSIVGLVVPFLAISILFDLGISLIRGILHSINNPEPSYEDLKERSKHWNSTWEI